MNKRAQGNIIFLFMIGTVFFLLGLALTPAITSAANEAMNSPQLNCSNSSISDQDKAVCTSIDIQAFLFIATIFGLAGIILTAIITR